MSTRSDLLAVAEGLAALGREVRFSPDELARSMEPTLLCACGESGADRDHHYLLLARRPGAAAA